MDFALHLQGDISRPELIAASPGVRLEGAYRVADLLDKERRGPASLSPWAAAYLAWLRNGMAPHIALSERSAIYCAAKCYYQA